MKATVRLFALLREKAGTSRLEVELPRSATVEDLLRELSDRFPWLPASTSSTMVAVNRCYVEPSHVLAEGDDVALIPPVSGGACDPDYP